MRVRSSVWEDTLTITHTGFLSLTCLVSIFSRRRERPRGLAKLPFPSGKRCPDNFLFSRMESEFKRLLAVMIPSLSRVYSSHCLDDGRCHVRELECPIYPESSLLLSVSFISLASHLNAKILYFFQENHFNLALDPIPFRRPKFPHPLCHLSISTLFLPTEYFLLHQVSPV